MRAARRVLIELRTKYLKPKMTHWVGHAAEKKLQEESRRRQIRSLCKLQAIRLRWLIPLHCPNYLTATQSFFLSSVARIA
jgi:hypothetical protein